MNGQPLRDEPPPTFPEARVEASRHVLVVDHPGKCLLLIRLQLHCETRWLSHDGFM